MKTSLTKIISGGQTGADQGALAAAKFLGLETGGFAPFGWRTEDGPAPWLANYDLLQAASSGYPTRTKLNVINSQGTLIFGNEYSAGCVLTGGLCETYTRPFLPISWASGEDLPDTQPFINWLSKTQVAILNVAGNRESKQPGINDAIYRFLVKALED